MADRVWLTIGDALRSARERRGWTQTDLAAEIGVSRPQIANIERGFSYPSTQTIEEVCTALRAKLTCGPLGWRLA